MPSSFASWLRCFDEHTLGINSFSNSDMSEVKAWHWTDVSRLTPEFPVLAAVMQEALNLLSMALKTKCYDTAMVVVRRMLQKVEEEGIQARRFAVACVNNYIRGVAKPAVSSPDEDFDIVPYTPADAEAFAGVFVCLADVVMGVSLDDRVALHLLMYDLMRAAFFYPATRYGARVDESGKAIYAQFVSKLASSL